MPGRRLFLRRRHVFAVAGVGVVPGSSRLSWRVLGGLGTLEAEVAGDLLSEGTVLSAQVMECIRDDSLAGAVIVIGPDHSAQRLPAPALTF